MRNFIRIARKHGIQYVPDLRRAKVSPLFRGRPVIQENITSQEAADLAALCPAGAIQTDPVGIHLGKCVFCRECEFACPGKIRFTNDYLIAVNDPADLLILPGDHQVRLRKEKVNPQIPKMFRNSLKLRQVSAGGDNSGEMELNAAGNVNFDMGRFGVEFVASPRHADGIVITGPITVNMAEALQICHDAVPSPKIVVLAGTDAISGGLYNESPALNRAFLDKYRVDLYVPGNPAHPLTFINGILDLIDRVSS
jgi:Ni,Fe-hydrogenase III small subunit/NAD-dependent dihydropyrimidine dehydrogenase PreA subunit